jgi:flagellar protein FliO/FliZ
LNESFFASNSFSFTLVAAAIALVAASTLIFFVFRAVFGRRIRLPRNGRTRPVRLAIIDAFDLDRQRQLVIVRRDNVEHLLMIGGPNDLVIESQIIRSESRESRSLREAKFRDKELREREPRDSPLAVAGVPSPAPAEADLSVSRHKMPPPPAAGVEPEALPPELLERAQQKWEPGFRQDTRQKRELEFDDDARNLGFEEPLRVHAPVFSLPTAKSPVSPTPARRSPLDPLSGQRTPAHRESVPIPDGPSKKRETITNPAARAPRAPVTTPFLRPARRRQVQDTGSNSAPSHTPEAWPNEPSVVSNSEGPEAFAGLNNAEAVTAPPVMRQAETDAGGFGANCPDTGAVPEANGRSQRSDPLELEMARLLNREPG